MTPLRGQEPQKMGSFRQLIQFAMSDADETKPAPSSSLFNFSLGDIFGAGKGVEKLIAMVGGGAGRVADGISEVASVKWLDKTRAENEAYRTQMVGDAQTRVMEGRARVIAALAHEGQHLQNMTITEGGINAQLAGVSPEIKSLHERAQRRVAIENVMQQLNRETAVACAAIELADEQEVSEDLVDPDWLTRYFRTVQDITREDAQIIYGKILAGEVKQPGTFSARTIDFLATLTQDKGRQFRDLCSFCLMRDGIAPYVVVFDTDEMEHDVATPSFYELTHLQNIGLINFSTGMLRGYVIHQETAVFTYGASNIEVEARTNTSNQRPIVDLGVVMLTAIGQELAQVCQSAADPHILEYLVSRWVKREHKVSVK